MQQQQKKSNIISIAMNKPYTDTATQSQKCNKLFWMSYMSHRERVSEDKNERKQNLKEAIETDDDEKYLFVAIYAKIVVSQRKIRIHDILDYFLNLQVRKFSYSLGIFRVRFRENLKNGRVCHEITGIH